MTFGQFEKKFIGIYPMDIPYIFGGVVKDWDFIILNNKFIVEQFYVIGNKKINYIEGEYLKYYNEKI